MGSVQPLSALVVALFVSGCASSVNVAVDPASITDRKKFEAFLKKNGLNEEKYVSEELKEYHKNKKEMKDAAHANNFRLDNKYKS
jgi:hypothetical protein